MRKAHLLVKRRTTRSRAWRVEHAVPQHVQRQRQRLEEHIATSGRKRWELRVARARRSVCQGVRARQPPRPRRRGRSWCVRAAVGVPAVAIAGVCVAGGRAADFQFGLTPSVSQRSGCNEVEGRRGGVEGLTGLTGLCICKWCCANSARAHCRCVWLLHSIHPGHRLTVEAIGTLPGSAWG